MTAMAAADKQYGQNIRQATRGNSIWAALLLSLSGLAIGLPAHAQSLDQTLRQALAFQSDIQLARLQVDEQQAALGQVQVQNGLRLQVQGELGMGYFGTSAAYPPSGNRVPRSLILTGSYPIYTAGRQELAVETAQTGIEAAQANVRAQKLSAALNVISIYSAIRRDELVLQLERDNQKPLDRAASDAAKRLKAGEVTKTDLAQAQAQQAQGRARQAQAQAAVLVAQSQLRQLTGQPFAGSSQALRIPAVPSLAVSLQRMSRHSALEAARLQVEVLRRQRQLAERELKPQVILAGQVGHQEDSDMLRDPVNVASLRLQASVPLWDSGRNRANIQRAQAAERVGEQRVEALRQQLEAQLRQQYAQLESGRLQRPALQQAVEAATLAYNTIQRELELGTKTTFDLLTAQQTLRQARTQVVINEEAQALAAYQILATNGDLAQQLAD